MTTTEVRPVVSVIVPTYRREMQVVDAVNSVLTGCGVDFEVIVVDDTPEASAKEAIAAIHDARVQYHVMVEPSEGKPAKVRNTALELAKGRYLYFLDDDDQVAAGGIDALVGALEAAPKKGVAFGRVRCVGPHEATLVRYNNWFTWAAETARKYRWSSRLTVGTVLFRGTLYLNSACLLRTKLARELGGYDVEMPFYEDVDFYTRGIRRSGHVFVDETVLVYSTGQPSLIHDLDEDWTMIASSYRSMHEKYKRTYGVVDYRLLQVASKLLPMSEPGKPATSNS